MSMFVNKNVSRCFYMRQLLLMISNYIFELKFMALDVCAYLDKGETTLKNKRQKTLNDSFPELSNLHKDIKEKCILDGEIVVMKNGKPDFYALQGRSLLSDPFKIKYQVIKNPAVFVAYDILYYKDKDITTLPLLEEKRY